MRAHLSIRRHALAAVLMSACGTDVAAQLPLAACEWCGAQDAPTKLGWSATIAPPGEPGIPMVVDGVVSRDGVPAANVLVYAYHTNSSGVYPRRGNETGNGRRHGYLRGWARTDSAGRFRFITIKPDPYPRRGTGISEPAHIHLTVTPPGVAEYYVDAIHFEGDPALTPSVRARLSGVGGSGVVRVVRLRGDTLGAVRNISLWSR